MAEQKSMGKKIVSILPLFLDLIVRNSSTPVAFRSLFDRGENLRRSIESFIEMKMISVPTLIE